MILSLTDQNYDVIYVITGLKIAIGEVKYYVLQTDISGGKLSVLWSQSFVLR